MAKHFPSRAATGHGSRATGHGPRAAGSGPWAANRGPRSTGHGRLGHGPRAPMEVALDEEGNPVANWGYAKFCEPAF